MAETLKRAQPFGLSDIDLRLPGEGEIFFDKFAVDNPNAFALFQRQGRGFKRLGLGDSVGRDEQIANLRKQGIDINIGQGGGASIQGKALQGFNLSDIGRAGRDFFDIDPRGNLNIQNIQDQTGFDLSNFAPQPDRDLGRTGDALAAQATGSPFNPNAALVQPQSSGGSTVQGVESPTAVSSFSSNKLLEDLGISSGSGDSAVSTTASAATSPKPEVADQDTQETGQGSPYPSDGINLEATMPDGTPMFTESMKAGIQAARQSQANAKALMDTGFEGELPEGVDIRDITAARIAAAQDQSDSNLNSYGIDNTKPDPTKSPLSYYEDLMGSLLESFGVGSLESGYNELSKEYADELASIQDNPFLSEAQRSSNVETLKDKFENRLMLAKDLIDSKRDEARWLATTALNAYHTDRQFNADELERAELRAERAAKAKDRDTLTQNVYRNGREVSVLFDRETGEEIMELGELKPDALQGLRADLLRTQIAKAKADAAGEAGEELSEEAQSFKTSVELNSLISGLINDQEAIDALTGLSFWAESKIPGSKAYDANSTLERILGVLTFDSIEKLRGLGHMSDREFRSLAKLNTTLKGGQSREFFLNELMRLGNDVTDSLAAAGISSPQMGYSVANSYGITPDQADSLDFLQMLGGSSSGQDYSYLFEDEPFN